MNFLRIPEEIKNEFTVDVDGKAYLSQSALARLCGVSQSAINQLLERIATSKVLSKSLQPFAGNDYRGISKMIPDTLAAAIINHFAMFSRHKTARAKEVAIAFQAVGIRTWIQAELGWKQKQQDSGNYLDAIAIAENCLIKAGLEETVIQAWVIDQHIEKQPENSDILQNAKKLIAANADIPELPLSPTELGEILAERQGLDKPISARKINQMLIDAGLQTATSRIGRSGKKKIDYHLTEMAKQQGLGQVQTTTKKSDGSMAFQVRWFHKVLNLL